MKWSQLDDTEVKVLDCAHSNKCMPDEWQGQSSFIELLANEKEQRGLSVESSSDLTSEEQAALQVVAAHLVYLEKTEEMVKRTQGMMDEVLKDKTMGLEEKIQALHMLTGHLTLLQESAKKTMEGMGMDTSEFDTEEKEEEEEDQLMAKMHKGSAEPEEKKPDGQEAEKKPDASSEEEKTDEKPATDGKEVGTAENKGADDGKPDGKPEAKNPDAKEEKPAAEAKEAAHMRTVDEQA